MIPHGLVMHGFRGCGCERAHLSQVSLCRAQVHHRAAADADQLNVPGLGLCSVTLMLRTGLFPYEMARLRNTTPGPVPFFGVGRVVPPVRCGWRVVIAVLGDVPVVFDRRDPPPSSGRARSPSGFGLLEHQPQSDDGRDRTQLLWYSAVHSRTITRASTSHSCALQGWVPVWHIAEKCSHVK